MPGETLTEAFVARVVDDAERRRGAALRRHVGRSLFDFCACARAGYAAARETVVLDGEGATVLGSGETSGAGAVAASNAAASHALDRDDLHWPSLTHPGGVVWAVVLALGEHVDAAGADAVRAAVAGYEASARLALALGPAHRRHWHATATAGTVGAAVAAGLVLGLDRAECAHAAGHAVSVTGGSLQCVVERSGTRVFHRAHAARTAIAAAVAAAGGLPATRLGLESERGLFAATAAGSDPNGVLRGGERLAIEELTLRAYAATGFAHTAVDAALEVGAIEPETVRRIRIVAPPASVALAAIPNPESDDEAWWSVPYAVAVVLAAGDARALERRDLLHDQRVRGLLAVTELAAHSLAPDDLSAEVTVELDGGTSRRGTCAFPLGHPRAPLSDAALIDKWLRLDPRGDERAAEALLELACRLDEHRVRDVVARLAVAR
jgi:2-methylcitrate dehydratase PrpD